MKKALTYLGLTALALFLAAPFVWMLLVSLHPSRQAIPDVADLWPADPQWQNYSTVLFRSEVPVFRFFLNSVIVALGIVIGQVLICSMAAFGLSRLSFRGREFVFSLFLISMMFASTVTQIPVFLMLREWRWLDTYAALIVPGVSSAFIIFLMRQFFLQLPRELDEAARIDGASDWGVYWRLILPMSRPVLSTAATFAFIGAWTDFFWPLLSTNSLEMRTLEVGLSIFKNSYGGSDWPLTMTSAVIVMVPLLVVFLVGQRQFVRGITLGSLK